MRRDADAMHSRIAQPHCVCMVATHEQIRGEHNTHVLTKNLQDSTSYLAFGDAHAHGHKP